MSEEAAKAVREAMERMGDPNVQRTIELDCPPGGTRPGDLIANVIAGTGLEAREPVSKLFGEWTWDYNDVPQEDWDRIKPVLAERIRALYDKGVIRYGSW